MVNIGLIGLSKENGHPFSFSAIINGYDEDEFSQAGWSGILAYLKKRDTSEIATLNAKVTHVWTQDASISNQLSKSCNIPNIVNDYIELVNEVDAVVIARDDYETHYEMALPFLKNGTPVFIDKPLTLNIDELKYFRPFIEQGLLMSCSGFRFCSELDTWRKEIKEFGDLRLIQATVVNGWDKYGIHMIDAILSFSDAEPVSVESVKLVEHDVLNIEMSDGCLCQINALGTDVIAFSLNLYGTKNTAHVNIRDNFTSFRRTLFRFIEQVKTGKPAIDPSQTIISIKTLIAGRMALNENRRIYLKDLEA